MKILWDFDGTLFDTYPAYTDILYAVMEAKKDKHDISSQLKISFTHAIKHFELSDEQVNFFFDKESQMHPSLTPPFHHLREILSYSELNVIMTHKPRNEVEQILQYYGMEIYFQDMIAGDDGYPRKPDPASYQVLQDRYGIDLVIGDREIDILPAKALGIKSCLFQNQAPCADYYLSSYEEFFDTLILEK
ncbi:HAD-IA family hydrolase [Paenibacillus paeoniae]|uniref:HAD family hydrolase n=1 Tax=Paenibacillus paeoniae TaxID=2292705 RepID=A0A371PLG0_9BACL|nr:HAD-IA family hydrolase [Paenibacillus paeoniae]REK77042.1 HAD family hydrolase [Paenibacillus paeoniae]